MIQGYGYSRESAGNLWLSFALNADDDEAGGLSVCGAFLPPANSRSTGCHNPKYKTAHNAGADISVLIRITFPAKAGSPFICRA